MWVHFAIWMRPARGECGSSQGPRTKDEELRGVGGIGGSRGPPQNSSVRGWRRAPNRMGGLRGGGPSSMFVGAIDCSPW